MMQGKLKQTPRNSFNPQQVLGVAAMMDISYQESIIDDKISLVQDPYTRMADAFVKVACYAPYCQE